MQRKAYYIWLIILLELITSVGYAEDNSPRTIGEIPINLVLPDEQSKSTSKILLSEQDKQLAFAISEGSFIASYKREDLVQLTYDITIRIVKYCRYSYDKDKVAAPFREYVRDFINKSWSGCSKWYIYYEAFLDE